MILRKISRNGQSSITVTAALLTNCLIVSTPWILCGGFDNDRLARLLQGCLVCSNLGALRDDPRLPPRAMLTYHIRYSHNMVCGASKNIVGSIGSLPRPRKRS